MGGGGRVGGGVLLMDLKAVLCVRFKKLLVLGCLLNEMEEQPKPFQNNLRRASARYVICCSKPK